MLSGLHPRNLGAGNTGLPAVRRDMAFFGKIIPKVT
jgi:hypothetical protein